MSTQSSIGPSFIFCLSRVLVIKYYALLDTVICPWPESNYYIVYFSADIGITEEKVTAFLREATLMSNFNHANVLDLIGVVYTDGYMPAVVLPFMHRGDIRALIQSEDEVWPAYCYSFTNSYVEYCLSSSRGISVQKSVTKQTRITYYGQKTF